ncbi:uncharacterized protein PHALS_12708 [Plasmopara halstedii]|uniref:Uncharacterized protein n=1 Tax=Plasmopara halstedii TaxID=4781 RepID=A0A0P1AN76_PLAHL|nr:uncharacterized protein PHALS_12708 [Plasmopara halstedii]CEG42430.1 hypothetical protein PHALS_12708 [Plasmopara halstedii]|eukprot:XP_024578799.1 hypothetical protein PHALS_12708 [Plasmopara halstedii]
MNPDEGTDDDVDMNSCDNDPTSDGKEITPYRRVRDPATHDGIVFYPETKRLHRTRDRRIQDGQ